MGFTFLVILMSSATMAASSGVPLEKVTDSTQLPPGVTGTFIIGRPESCMGAVFFPAFRDGARIGLNAASPQGLTVIADNTTPVPGTANTFQSATRPDCAGDRLVFLGAGDLSSITGQAGIYVWQQGVIGSPLLETDMPLGGSHIQSFSSLDANRLGVVADVDLFPAGDRQVIVMMPFDGTPVIVADQSTVLPGQTSPVSIMARPILVGSDIVFHGRTGSNVGIYRWRQGEGLSLVADTLTAVPIPGKGNFLAFGIFTGLSGRVVFRATYLDGLGLFAFQDGQFEPVVVPGDTTADGATLTLVEEPSGAGDLLTFMGRTPEDGFAPAVFVKKGDGPIRRIWGVGDIIEGREVHRVLSDADHRDVLAWAEAQDPPGIQFVYRARFAAAAEIPALALYGAVALGLALGISGWRVLRRQLARGPD